jgi:hypothetical protein
MGDWDGDGHTDIACRNTGKVALSTGTHFLAWAGQYITIAGTVSFSFVFLPGEECDYVQCVY